MFTKAVITSPLCSECQAEMRLVPAGISKKTGKEYSAFWSCPNGLRGCGGKTIKYTEPTPKAPQKPYNKSTEAFIPTPEALIPKIKETEIPRDAIMVDLLNEINGKLDSLDMDIQIIIKEIVPQEN